ASPRPAARVHAMHGDGSIFSGLLRGYRFLACEDAATVARALEVRRRVYRDACGYRVPVPDVYDRRSWLLLAEDAGSGEPVGSMRVTPRWAGRLETEESFVLPADVLSPRLVEVTRFAVLPRHRDSKRFLPAVALGLLKLGMHFVRFVGADRVVVCSRLDRAQTYTWLCFRPTGLVGAYRPLDGAEHAVLTCDLRGGLAPHRDHRYWAFFVAIAHPEIVLPARVPPLGIVDPAPRGPRLVATHSAVNAGCPVPGSRNVRS
ncbi:MAG: N-acyl amino acid synthase FeeM domain-containing protein, partial [Thermoanaerobaculia bacterium]